MGRARKIANSITTAMFSAFRTANQALTSGEFTKVRCDGEEFDTAGTYDPVTNFRFQPQVEGYYQINAGVLLKGTTVSIAILLLYKNGSLQRRGNDIRAALTGYVAPTLSTLVYMNGTTDYLELFIYAGGTDLVLEGSTAADNFFQGALVRPV